MSKKYPNIINANWKANDFQLAKEMIDFAIDVYQDRQNKYSEFDKIYMAYNGEVDFDTRSWIDRFGKKTKVKYVDYRLARNKVNLLIGEYDELGIDSTVHTVNKEAMSKKLKRLQRYIGKIDIKNEIEFARKNGLNVYPNEQIPEYENPLDAVKDINLKLEIEIALNYIMKTKIRTERIKRKFSDCMKELIITSETHAVVERDEFNNDTIRPIPPKQSIFLEVTGDDFCEKSPVRGEVKFMTEADIVTQLNLTKKEIDNLENEFDTLSINRNITSGIGDYLWPVYFIQWPSVEKVITKVIDEGTDNELRREISENEYNKSKFQKGLKEKKYNTDIKYVTRWMSGVRIGKSLYKNIDYLKNVDVRLNSNGKYKSYSDYVSILHGTTNGIRVSMFQMIMELSTVYNIIRWQINREISRLKGNIILYDKAFIGTQKSVKEVLFDMLEEGSFGYNSAVESAPDNGNPKDYFMTLNLSDTGNINALILAAQDIERVVDLLTGINDNRQGKSKASQTAYSAEQDLSASRLITKPIFMSMKDFEEECLMKLLNKTRLNTDYLENIADTIISEGQQVILLNVEDIELYEFALEFNNGRREMELKNSLKSLYEPSINAKELSVSDIAEAELKETFGEYVQVLRNGWKRAKEYEAQMQMQANEAKNQQISAQIQQQKEQVEDVQQHDKDMALLQGQIDEKLLRIEKGLERLNQGDKLSNDRFVKTKV